MKLTADTITDEQIRALGGSGSDRTIRRLCKIALNDAPTYLRASVVRDARARCAEILSAREITADTITDEQINEVGIQARAALEVARADVDAALIALTYHANETTADIRRRMVARARCAEILNAKSKAK